MDVVARLSKPNRFGGALAREAATSLGVSVKTLRVYEEAGLLAPARDRNGYRRYDAGTLARAAVVARLRALGFDLKAIGTVLAAPGCFAVALAAQEKALTRRAAQAAADLAVVRLARSRLATGEPSLPALLSILEDLPMTTFEFTPELKKLSDTTFTPAQLTALAERKEGVDYDQAAVSAQWAELIAEAECLRPGGPDHPAAHDLARRWGALAAQFTRNQPDLDQAVGTFYRKGFADPTTRAQMPFSPEIFAFVQAAAISAKAAAAGEDSDA